MHGGPVPFSAPGALGLVAGRQQSLPAVTLRPVASRTEGSQGQNRV